MHDIEDYSVVFGKSVVFGNDDFVLKKFVEKTGLKILARAEKILNENEIWVLL